MLEFILRKLEHEISGESLSVPADGLIQDPCFHAVQLRQVSIQQDLLTADEQNRAFDALGGNIGAVACHRLTTPVWECGTMLRQPAIRINAVSDLNRERRRIVAAA
jgi:hypothetical protein